MMRSIGGVVMPAVIQNFSNALYNDLADVDDADAKLIENPNKFALFEALTSDIPESELSDVVGICLLHKHYTIAENSVMVESLISQDGVLGLEMRATPLDSLPMVPISWKICITEQNLEIFPIEFSAEQYAFNLYDKLMENADAFERIASLISKFGLENLVGITLLRQVEIDKSGFDLIEKTNDERRSHITLPDTLDDSSDKIIQTVWKFEKVIDPTLGCMQRCIPLSQCRGGNYGHEKYHFHSPDHPTVY
jgi:hypothetical protein